MGTLATLCLTLATVLAIAAPGTRSAWSTPVAETVLPGIDVWIERGLAPLAGARVGVITNTTGRTRDGRGTLEVLLARDDIQVGAIFTPEHALAASLEGPVEDGVHSGSGLPLFSLYGDHLRPTAEMLAGLEGLVFDIQDVGTRYYTYATTMGYAMEEAARHGLPFVVLDRPNPINGLAVSGAVKHPSIERFHAYAPIPVRHGMTMGELASFLNAELAIGADLTVVPMRGWRRSMWFDDTGLLWVNPSPNIRNLTQATLYPAVGVLEWTNLSVGRGTDAPFEWLGAPWIDPVEWAAALTAIDLPGIGFVPRRHTPESGPWAGETCGGVNLLLLDREAYDAGATAAALATTLEALYGDRWERDRLPLHWGDPEILEQLTAGWPPERVVGSWRPGLEAFERQRREHLLYD